MSRTGIVWLEFKIFSCFRSKAEKVFRPWWDTLEAGPHDLFFVEYSFLMVFSSLLLIDKKMAMKICQDFFKRIILLTLTTTKEDYVHFPFRTTCLTPLFSWVSQPTFSFSHLACTVSVQRSLNVVFYQIYFLFYCHWGSGIRAFVFKT